ncbi:MAG: hypothetical protein MHM6MM_002744 [Cercozoa sp. M6MM]
MLARQAVFQAARVQRRSFVASAVARGGTPRSDPSRPFYYRFERFIKWVLMPCALGVGWASLALGRSLSWSSLDPSFLKQALEEDYAMLRHESETMHRKIHFTVPDCELSRDAFSYDPFGELFYRRVWANYFNIEIPDRPPRHTYFDAANRAYVAHKLAQGQAVSKMPKPTEDGLVLKLESHVAEKLLAAAE